MSRRRPVLSGRRTATFDLDTSGLEGLLDELGAEAEEAMRPAAQAGAQVLYEEVQRNVAGMRRVSGNLARAIYQVYSKESSTEGRQAVYHVSWNHRKAPHGHLLEYGWMQRYVYARDERGRFFPLVRPGMDGTKKPRRRASQAEKDAYYVPLPTPRHIPGKAFVRRASVAYGRAMEAAENELKRRILAKAKK